LLLLAGAKIRPEICPSPRGDECTQMRALLRSVLRGIFRLLMAVVLFPRIRTLQRLHADVVRLRKNLDDSCANLNALGAACDDLRIELERLRLPRFTGANASRQGRSLDPLQECGGARRGDATVSNRPVSGVVGGKPQVSEPDPQPFNFGKLSIMVLSG
jgi:hypothetical protein